MRGGLSRSTLGSLVAIAALVAFKLLLVSAQPVRGISSAAYDDALFVDLTRFLIHSNWLGDYSQVTLAKGPGAPLFFATAWTLHVPIPIAQHILYALACALVVLALAPIEPRRHVLVVSFAILLFNPMTYDAGTMTRVNRSIVYASAILAALASWVGLAAWNARLRHWRAIWAATGGLAIGLAWITREETVMIVPALALIAIGCALWIRNDPARGRASTYISGLLAGGAVALAFVGTVALVNFANYGAFAVTEMRGGPYSLAYGALTRIPPFDEAEEIAMTDAARLTAYAVSPSFRELEPVLEGALGDYWISQSKFFVHLPSRGRGFHRAWFLWALRDAAAATGHHDSASDASQFYDRIAKEVNAACADPVLACGPPRSSPIPALDRGRAIRVARSWLDAAQFVLTFRDFTAWSGTSIGNDFARFREITRWPVLPEEGTSRSGRRLWILEALGRSWGVASPVVFSGTMIAFLTALVLAARQRRLVVELVLASGSLALALSCVTVVAMVDALAFPAINMLYLAPAYPAVALFWCMAVLALGRLVTGR